MGCVCCSLSQFVSVLLDAFERVSVCTVCAMLTCCLMFTILTVLVMGIGIGFHYCFVQTSAEAMARAAKATGGQAERSGRSSMMRSIDKAVARGFTHHVGRRDADAAAQRITNNNNLTNNDTFWRQGNYTLQNLTQFVTS